MGEVQSSKNDTLWRDILILLLAVCGFHLICNVAFLTDDRRPPHYDPSDHFQICMAQYRQITATLDGEATWASLPMRVLKVNEYYPPLFYLSATPFFAAGGVSFQAARATNTLYLFLLVFAVYGIGSRLYNRGTGLLSAIVISLYPIVFGLSRDLYPDLALLAWVAVTVYFLLCTDGLRRTGMAVVFGAAYGLGQLTKQPFTFFAIGPCVYYFLQSTFPPKRLLVAFRAPLRIAARNWAVPVALLVGLFLGLHALRLGLSGVEGFVAKLLLGIKAIAALASLVIFVLLAKREWKRLEMDGDERAVIGDVWKRIGNSALAGLVAFAIAGPFYLINWETVSTKGQFVVTQAGVDRGMASPSEAIFDYAGDIFDKQVQPIFTILLLIGLVATPRRYWKSHAFLIASFLSAYIIMSTFRTKDPRYTMPFLYALAPLSVAWIATQRETPKRVFASAVVIVLGLAQFLMISFGWGGYPRVLRDTKLGSIVRISPYGSAHGEVGDWSNSDIVADIERYVARDEGDAVSTTTLFDTDYLRFATLRCQAMTRNLPLAFANPRDDLADDYARRLYELSISDCILTKTGYQGQPFTLRAIADLRQEFEDPQSNIRSGFSLLKSYNLPDGSSARLWVRKDRWESAGPPSMALPVYPLEIAGGVQLLGAVVDAPFIRLGEKLPLYMAWELEDGFPDNMTCYIQLRDRTGAPIHSEQVPLNAGSRVPIEALGSADLQRYEIYLNPDSGAQPGSCSAVLIFTDATTGQVLVPRVASNLGNTENAPGDFGASPIWWEFEPVSPGRWQPLDRVRGTIPPECAAGEPPVVQPDGVVLLGGIELRETSAALPGEGMLFN